MDCRPPSTWRDGQDDGDPVNEVTEKNGKNPRLGWRVFWLGLVFAGMFALLFTRLWFVQVAAGAVYEAAALAQQVVAEPLAPPRGDIVDAGGNILAGSRIVPVLVIDRSDLNGPEDEALLVQQLAALFDVPPVLVRTEIGAGTREPIDFALLSPEQAAFVVTHSSDFPGASIVDRPQRVYPEGETMAHVIGYLGQPSQDDLNADPSLDPNAPLGRFGVEATYDETLRGSPGYMVSRTAPDGRLLDVVDRVQPEQGLTVRLTIDLEIQRFVEGALSDGIALARDEGSTRAQRGAAVVLDPRDGSIRALASLPAYDPQSFVGGIGTDEFEELNASQAFNNLAIQGLFPPASTFKAITYVTAIEEQVFPDGAESKYDLVECSPTFKAQLGDESQQLYRNWTYPLADGYQDLNLAFERSCNIYFWGIALDIWHRFQGTERENVLQDWARRFGFGTPTGVDLPFERPGVVPDRQLFDEWAEAQPGRVRPEGWLGGDLMNIAVGQGTLLVTPIQLAAAYAAAVNGGNLIEPRVVDRVLDQDGAAVVINERNVAQSVGFDVDTAASLREAMGRVVSRGTASAAFAEMGELRSVIGGKTGTAQMGGDRDDTAWFVGVAPLEDPQYVVVVVIEEGGSGGQIAAPVARMIFQYLLGVEVAPIHSGDRTD